MANLIDTSRLAMSSSPVIAAASLASQNVYIGVASELITLFCAKFAPEVTPLLTATPVPATIQEATVIVIEYLLTFDSQQLGMMSESVPNYSYTRENLLGNKYLLPELAIKLILVNRLLQAPKVVKEHKHRQYDIWSARREDGFDVPQIF